MTAKGCSVRLWTDWRRRSPFTKSGSMSKPSDAAAPPDPSRVLDEAAVIVLDQLAVEGGRATRDELFDRCKAAFFGRMVNAAARRAGYEGHDEAEIERR